MFELYHKAIKKARVFLAKPGFFLFFYVLIELSKWQTREGSYLTASFSNNGIPPERPVTETGGLAVLRKTVEDSGGSMSIQSEPTFLLSISIPKNK